ncbi:uncharacterized protein SCHCODRAFT_01175256 [Schizophyllum commune H4-8]|nr:uncharacterized protein SCHCODRAFT_01175256 [Schizophyllum commune H4-8]KAI5886734.1 hypothetical protein SCHCODRAFT_01175256 [Schizophyllum commune H4-8]
MLEDIGDSVMSDNGSVEGGLALTDRPVLSTLDSADHYMAFLQVSDGHCGLCLVRTLAQGGRGTSPDMAHDWQTCPNLSTEDARQEFHAFRANIKYARGHGVCWVCHIAPAGPNMLHNNPPLELHPYRRVGLMMAWGIFSDLQLKPEAYRDLVESSACPAARKHSWDTVREFAEWIADQDATGEPTSVMAVMNFVRRKYM